MRSIRTDLAAEARDFAPEASGVRHQVSEDSIVSVTRVFIDTEQGALALGKPVGEYITLDAPRLMERDTDVFSRVAGELSSAIRSILEKKSVKRVDAVMVVGLGNRAVTADSLGPKVVEKTLVTRHLYEFMPEQANSRMRPVCAFAPGVLGVTGMETGEMVQSIAKRIRPRLVIAIDALASRSTERLGTSIQLADTGIHPGSGLGGKRAGLNEETLGVPVLAVGVPLVVHASTLSRDAVSLLIQRNGGLKDEEEEEKLLSLVDEVVSEKIGPLVVTPKEIDVIVSDLASLIAKGVNLALHELEPDEIEQFMS